jgi:hypothetical protein
MDAITTDAPYVINSELAQWAMGSTGGGLPEVEICAECEPEDATAPAPDDTGAYDGNPIVTVTADVQYDGATPYGLTIEAQAFDPAEGRTNGAGIDYVYFTIYDTEGNVLFENDEQNAAYCAFGGDRPCPSGSLNELFGGEVPPGGTYVVEARALTDRGLSATASTEFTLDDSSGANGESDPPVIAGVSSDPSDGFCSGDSLVINANVYGTAVTDVTLWWRAYTDDGGVTDFTAYAMYGSNGYYQADLSGTNAEIVEYYVSASDAAGNYVETAPYSISGAYCSS